MTTPAAETVAVAVGRVVQVPPVTVTRGGVAAEYPEPPPLVGIVAIVPVLFDIAVAVVPVTPEALKVTALTVLVTISIVAVALSGVVHVPPETVTLGLTIYPEPGFVIVIFHAVLTVAVAVTGVPVPVGGATVNVVPAGQVIAERTGGALTVTVGVPVQVDGIVRSLIVASSPRLLSCGTQVNPVQPVQVNPPIVTVGRFVDE